MSTLSLKKFNQSIQLQVWAIAFVAILLAPFKPAGESFFLSLERFEMKVSKVQQKEFLIHKPSSKMMIFKGNMQERLQTLLLKKVPSKLNLSVPYLANVIRQEAIKYNFDPFFLAAIIEGESTFKHNIVGSFGEIGLMQIKPDTAAWINKKYKLGLYRGRNSLFNMETNIRIGSAYLSYLRKKFNHRGQLYIAAYNMGARNVRRALRKQVVPKDYMNHIMKKYNSGQALLEKRGPAFIL